MKRILTLSSVLIILVCLCSCGNKEDLRYDAIYNKKTGQYIALGDSSVKVEEVLGDDNNYYIEYDDNGKELCKIRITGSKESITGIDFEKYDDDSNFSYLNMNSQKDFLNVFPGIEIREPLDVKMDSGAAFLIAADSDTKQHYYIPSNATYSNKDEHEMVIFIDFKAEKITRVTLMREQTCHGKHYLKDLKVYEE